MKKYFVLLAMLMLTASAFAADFNGKWIAQLTNYQGNTERIFNLAVGADGKVTGTIINQLVAPATFEQPGKPTMSGILKTQTGKTIDIAGGQVTGDTVSFSMVATQFGNQITTIYTGTLSGDELSLTTESKVPEGAKGQNGAPLNPPAAQKMVAKKASN